MTVCSFQIKYYLEGSGKNASTVQEVLQRVIVELGSEWMQSEKNNLGIP